MFRHHGNTVTRLAAAMTLACCASAMGAGNVRINEIRIDHPGAPVSVADKQEYIELAGEPGTSLDDLRYVVVGDSGPEGGNSGAIEKIINLDGNTIGPSGLFVIAQAGFTLSGKNHTVTIDFEDGGTVTHMLVSNLAGASHGTSIDTEYDGFVDYEPWDEVLDAIAIIDPDDDTYPYGPGGFCTQGPNCNEIVITQDDPGHVYRCGNTGKWMEGAFEVGPPPTTDTPTKPNACPFADSFEAP